MRAFAKWRYAGVHSIGNRYVCPRGDRLALRAPTFTLQSWLMRVGAALYATFGVAAAIRDNLLSPSTRAKWDTFGLLPHWSAGLWTLAAVAVLLVGAIEGSYRLDQRRQMEAREVEERLREIEDRKPRIENVWLSLASPRPGHFDLLVDTVVGETTGVTGWALEIETPAGPAPTFRGIVMHHALAPGSWQLTVSFPYGNGVPDRAALKQSTLQSIRGVDTQRRDVSFRPPKPGPWIEKWDDNIERTELKAAVQDQYGAWLTDTGDLLRRQDALIQAIVGHVPVAPGAGESAVTGEAPTVIVRPADLGAVRLEAAATHAATLRIGDIFKNLGYAIQRKDGVLEADEGWPAQSTEPAKKA